MQSGRFRGLFLSVLIVLTVSMFIRTAEAQANRAAITGTLTDTTGAIVPGV